jgi:hypothetical protein
VKKALAWAMVILSVGGLVTSVWPWRLYAEGEPVTVLALSWLALLFAGLDGVFVVHEE